MSTKRNIFLFITYYIAYFQKYYNVHEKHGYHQQQKCCPSVIPNYITVLGYFSTLYKLLEKERFYSILFYSIQTLTHNTVIRPTQCIIKQSKWLSLALAAAAPGTWNLNSKFLALQKFRLQVPGTQHINAKCPAL